MVNSRIRASIQRLKSLLAHGRLGEEESRLLDGIVRDLEAAVRPRHDGNKQQGLRKRAKLLPVLERIAWWLLLSYLRNHSHRND